MNDPSRTDKELLEEMAFLKQRIRELEKSESDRKRAEQEMAIITEIGRVIGSTLNIDEVYEQFAAEVRKLIPFDRIHVTLKSPDGETFTIAYVSGTDIAGRRRGDKVPLAGSITETLFRTRIGLCFHPASEEELVGRFPNPFVVITFRAGMRSIMAVPLISRDEVIGVMHFWAEKPNAYMEQDLRLAERIGMQVAGTIANATLYSNLDRLAKEMAIIAEIGKVIGSTLNIREVYDRFAEEVQKLIPFDRLSVLKNINPEEDTFTTAYVNGTDIPGRRPGDVVPLHGSFCEMVMQRRKGMFNNFRDSEDMSKRFPNVILKFANKVGLFSMISVPLISRDEVIGTLHFRSSKPNAYTEADLRLAERIGSQIAGAIANEQFYAELKKTHDTLEERVKERTLELEETSIALRVLLKKREADQRHLGEGIQANIDQLVMPFMARLRATRISEQGLAYLNIVETNLGNIISPFINQMSVAYRNLTPKEIKIAFLIKEGKTSKEIAKLLGVSVGTIVTHRNNIRKKLRLKLKNTNLRSHLLFQT